MKNSGLKSIFGVLAVAGGIFAVKKITEKRKLIKGVLEEYDINEKTPFGIADKIRELSDEQYEELKSKLTSRLDEKWCRDRK
ncbi:MAG: hypothetical protein LBE36_00320 [Flavobacteriaceae bacterium]|jgi:hypothetical protein|nr:hypothetical protein [Flavobacteriaceae bacterium]